PERHALHPVAVAAEGADPEAVAGRRDAQYQVPALLFHRDVVGREPRSHANRVDCAAGGVEIDQHIVSRTDSEYIGVGACPAIQLVVARSAVEEVVARASLQHVPAAAAAERTVTAAAEEHGAGFAAVQGIVGVVARETIDSLTND